MPKTLDDFSDEEVEEIINSKMVQKYIAYRELASGINSLKDDSVMYEQLVQGIHNRYSRVNEETIKQVLEKFVDEVESNTEALKSVEEESEDSTGVKV